MVAGELVHEPLMEFTGVKKEINDSLNPNLDTEKRDRERGKGGTMRSPARFAAGKEVEVSHDDEGFGLVWSDARIVRSFADHRRYSVAFAADDDSRPLAKTFAAARIRPRPHPPSDPSGFRLYQQVEALHNGSWRPGVVSRLPLDEEERFAVCFPIQREELEFGVSQLRPQIEWVDGEWVSLDDKGTAETIYKTGTKVEVAHVWKKIPVAWYTAIIVKVINQNTFLVEYETLRNEGDGVLKEIVDSRYVRPCPPHAMEVRNFRLLDEVEAFYGSGWWPGVVAKVHAGSRYNVKFMHLEEEIEFSDARLRLLYEWIDGQWIQASQDKSIKSQNNGPIKSAGRKKFLYASKTNDSKVLIKRFSSGHKFPICATYAESKNQEKNSFPNQLESSRACKKSKKGEAIEDNTLLSEFLLVTRGNRTPSAVKIGFDVTTPIIEEPNFHIKAIPERCFSTNPFKEGNVLNQRNATDTPLNNFFGEINDEPLAPAISSRESPMLHTPLSTIGPSNNVGEFSSMPRGERSRHSDMSEHPCSSLGHETNDFHGGEQSKNGCCPIVNDQQRNGTSSRRQLQQGMVSFDCSLNLPATGVKRRKRDRPRKLKVKTILQGGPMKGQNDNKPVGGTPVEDRSTSHVEAINPPETLANCSEAEVINGIVGSPDASFVESSLSGVQLSEIGNEAQNEVLHQTLEQVEKRALLENERAAIDLTHNKSHSRESVCLPFEKCSSMWENIESMEVFSTMPQQPHFRPLEQYCKEFREGMAIGLMVTFCNLVESIGKLWITDSQCKFDDILKTLEHLEGHGFDVQRIQVCLKELLRMKGNQEQLADKRSALEVMISEKQNKKDKLNTEIEVIDKVVMELTQALASLYEKKDSISERKGDSVAKMARLQKEVREVDDAILSAENDFEAILAAAW